MTDTPPGDPWVLVRKGKPPLKYSTLALAQRFFDQLRFNRPGGSDVGAVIFGPDGEAHYCDRFPYSQWVRQDERRKREAVKEHAEEDDGA